MAQTGILPKDDGRIVFLDYMRIFAFVSVLIGHKYYTDILALSNDATVHDTPRLIASLLLPLLYAGGAGVVVFFLVSGYIITHVLQTERPGEFLVKRAFRIYPLYIVSVLAESALLAVAGKPKGLSELLPQLLLVGDFLGTPYALHGVEWTLRVEVMFYVLMAALRWLGLMGDRGRLLPWALVAAALLCGLAAPIPAADFWSRGYVTLYAPFLLTGSMVYLFEKRQIGLGFLLSFVALVFSQYYHQIALYQKPWLGAQFAILAFGVFCTAWIFRSRLTVTPLVLLLSDMTYAVYLLHNWFLEYVTGKLQSLHGPALYLDVQALIVLLAVCYLLVRVIEKPGIRLGRAVVASLRKRRRVAF